MILVKSVEYVKVEGDVAEVLKQINDTLSAPYVSKEEMQRKVTFERQIVMGKRFVVNGEQVILGWDKDVEALIGVPLEAVDLLKLRNQQLNEKYENLNKKYKDLLDTLFNKNKGIQKAGFLTRMKYLFTKMLEV
jgi:hypothetical protein